MPQAYAVLAFLATFLALWSLSLIVRGMVGDRRKGLRRCPSCRQSLPDATALNCHACGYIASTQHDLLRRTRNWPLLAAGFITLVLAGFCLHMAIRVFRWTHQDPDIAFAGALWSAAAAAVVIFWLSTALWALRGERSRGRRRCPRCWYDMAGSGLACPECGHQSKHISDLYRPRRRKKLAIAAIVLTLTAVPVHLWPRYQRGGLLGLTPTTVLVAGMPWLPDSAILNQSGVGRHTLAQRLYNGELLNWQHRWLERRCRAVLASTDRLDLTHRCLSLLRDRPPTERSTVRARVAAALISSDPKQASEAARLIMWHGLYLGDQAREPTPPPAEDIARYLPQLRITIGNADSALALAAAALLISSPEDVAAAIQKVVTVASSGRGPHRWWARYILETAAATPEGLRAIMNLDLSENGIARSLVAQGVPLSAFKQPGVLAWFQPLLSGGDPNVAEAAVYRLRNSRCGLDLLIIAHHQSDGARRDMLYRAFGAMNDFTAEELTEEFRHLISSQDPLLRDAAIDLLRVRAAASEHQEFIAAALEPLMESPDAAIAAAAQAAIRTIREPAPTP